MKRAPLLVATMATALFFASDFATAQEPRVLLIGDSISIGYTPGVKELLSPSIEVHRNPGNAGHTGMGLENLPNWLAPANGKWDVIHFNWGLWDLCYRDPKSKGGRKREKVRGKLTHTVEKYAANLDKIVAQLEATGAELIFATTTPVPEGEPGRKVGDDRRYNEAALAVMRRRGVAINDLHGLVRDRMDKLAIRPGDVHFSKEGSQVLAEQVARSVKRALRQRYAAKPPGGRSPAWRRNWQPTRKLTYKEIGDVRLAVHIFEPDFLRKSDDARPDGLRPAIVFFFGGGWVSGKPAQFYPHCEYLASRGMVAIAAEYRVAKRHKTTPFECVKDAKSAIRWVRANARKLGIDPQRIAAGGGSAGGHLAAATAVVRGIEEDGEDLKISCVPNALVLFNPVYDNGPGGYGHGRVKERWREISPINNIQKGMPPAIVFFGTEDRLVPADTARAFQKKMREAGSRSELYLYDGRTHGFFNHGRGDGEDYKSTVRRADEFLASIGFLEGRPTIRAGAGARATTRDTKEEK